MASKIFSCIPFDPTISRLMIIRSSTLLCLPLTIYIELRGVDISFLNAQELIYTENIKICKTYFLFKWSNCLLTALSKICFSKNFFMSTIIMTLPEAQKGWQTVSSWQKCHELVFNYIVFIYLTWIWEQFIVSKRRNHFWEKICFFSSRYV